MNAYEKRRYACEECNKSYAQSQSLIEHINSAHKEQQYCCKDCGKEFSYLKTLQKHKKSVHGKKRQFKCEQYTSSYSSKFNLRKHISSQHESARENTSLSHSPRVKVLAPTAQNKVSMFDHRLTLTEQRLSPIPISIPSETHGEDETSENRQEFITSNPQELVTSRRLGEAAETFTEKVLGEIDEAYAQ